MFTMKTVQDIGLSASMEAVVRTAPLLAPCLIRDHHTELRRLIAQHEPDPSDEEARKALLDPDYARGMEEYGVAYQALTDPIWQEHYLQPGGRGSGYDRPLPESEHGKHNR